MPSPAELFDRTYVINLPERKDRRRAISSELNRLGMGFTHPRVALHPAKRCDEPCGFPSAAVRGCFLSHLSILRKARAEGLRNVLVIEDDLAMSPTLGLHWARLMQEVERQPWGFIYFGHVQRTSGATPVLLPHSGPLMTAHFYAVSATLFNPLIAYLEAVLERQPGDPVGGPMHYDGALTMFRLAHPEILTLIAHPSLGWQRSSRSDIHGRWYDKVVGLRNGADYARSIRQTFRNLRADASSLR
jgi:glycosyl transferase, family 25